MRSGHDVLEEDDGGENYLNNDGDIGFKKFVDKLGVTIDNGENNDDLENNRERSENDTGEEADPLGDVGQNRNKTGGDGADGNDGGDNPGDENTTLARTGPDGWVVDISDNSGGLKDTQNQIENNKHNIDEKTGDGVGEGDNKEGEKDLGNGGLEGGDVLGIDFHPEHDHKTIKNEDEDEDEVGDVSKSFPDGKNGQEILETVAGALGVDRLNDAVLGHVLAKTGKVIARADRWGLESETNDVSQLGDDTVAGWRGFGKIVEDIFAFGTLEKLEELGGGISVVSFDSAVEIEKNNLRKTDTGGIVHANSGFAGVPCFEIHLVAFTSV